MRRWPTRSGALQLLDDDAARGVDKNVIAIAILARGCVVAIAVALHGDDLVAGHALKGDRGAQVPAQRSIVRGQQWRAAQNGGEYNSESAGKHFVAPVIWVR